MNNKRLIQEYKKYQIDKIQLSTNGLINLYPSNDLYLDKWIGIITKDDMIWKLDIIVPMTYPSQPPLIKFSKNVKNIDIDISSSSGGDSGDGVREGEGDGGIGLRERIIMSTPPVHENINFHTGDICLDVISGQWTPAWSLSSACLAIIVLLDKGDESSPLNIDIANLRKCHDTKAISSLQNYYKFKYGTKLKTLLY